MEYEDFVKAKRRSEVATGHVPSDLNEHLFDFQHAIVSWAVRRGRAAIFADTGLGKTLMQLSWADEVASHTKGIVVILAPLAVSEQTIEQGKTFGIEVTRIPHGESPSAPGIWITNYERIGALNFAELHGIVLDESSILKSHNGKTRTAIIESCQSIPYRLSCTATPSPNDFDELGNQCEFLGVMTRSEMLATYFINDAGDTGTWILKGWGQSRFWEWMGSWAVVLRSPADIGFDGSRYDLPKLQYHEHVVATDTVGDELFSRPAMGLAERRKAQRDSIQARCKALADIVNAEPNEPWLIWCHLNDEADLVESLLSDCINVQGSDSPEVKTKNMMAFTHGDLRVLCSKPKICGYGMNWQHCARMAFVGLDDSFEKFYQAVRRCYRFGQKREVQVHIFTAENEGQILQNIKRKELQHHEMSANMIEHMKDIMNKELAGTSNIVDEYKEDTFKRDNFTVHMGDCVKWTRRMEDNSIDYSVFSPPFADLFTYSNSDHDMGNCKNDTEFVNQLKFLIAELFRVVKQGRNVSFHCMNLPTTKMRQGFIGLRDFRGDLIRAFQDAGFIYHSEVCIWKDPVVAMQRTKALGLLHKTIRENGTMSRMGLPDYVVTMRKPGEIEERVTHGDDLPVMLWQKYASPIWDDINQSRTLNKMPARDENDLKHMCPLQLDVIERCIHLWTNPGELIFSPFTGIGSEGYCAVKMGRKFVGTELKPSYFELACQNIEDAEKEQVGLFS
ncbi:DEXDc domain containing protein [uncultured Caudovirales phage]|uniref:DEXDc domain containing protein n=1 Tax=uncultured Caudovirales phage TaxID=2100421 RepID=A0A6J5RQQ5_9CAUD|nr:DEXDc domain containing protein [uncultured Caudovirales phage]